MIESMKYKYFLTITYIKINKEYIKKNIILTDLIITSSSPPSTTPPLLTQSPPISGAGYKCTGDISEWTKCTQVTKTPSRVAFKVDQEWKDECPYLFVH